MRDEAEQRPVVAVERGDEREWSDWWQSYWSSPPEEPPRDGPTIRQHWRESAHEFDFSGEE